MLAKLKLIDFQIHKRVKIDLGPVTTIIGPSDIGKTAIFRALRWLCLNKPSGKSFIRHKSEEAKAILLIDGQRIERIRGAENTYKLGKEEFKAFGNETPQPISEALRVTEENFQCQHDAPFWLSLTPGQVAKEINRIVSLDAIDKALEYLSNRKRKAKLKVSLCKESVVKARREYADLSYVPEVRKELDAIKCIDDHIASNRSDCVVLRQLIRDAESYESTLETASQAKSEAHKAIQAGEAIVETSQAYNHLRKLIESTEALRSQLCRAEEEQKQVEAKIKKLTKGRCPVCGASMDT